MRQIVKLLLISLLGWIAVILGIFLFSLIGLADAFFPLREVFARMEVTITYEFETFGIFFQIWVISALLPILSINLLTQAIAIETLIPLILLLIIGGSVGYYAGFKQGVPLGILILIWGLILGIVLAFFVPLTLPTAGLSPVDQASIRGLGDELIQLTYLIPLNFLVEVIATVVLVIGSVTVGIGAQKILTPEKTDKIKKTYQKRRAKSKKKKNTSKKSK